MRFSSISPADAAVFLTLLSAPWPAFAMLRCNHIVSDGRQYDLEKLGGPHSVVTTRLTGSVAHNTTYTLDICQPLKKKGKNHCINGSRVCAIRRLIGVGDEGGDLVDKVTPIAGELEIHGGGALDHEVTQLSQADPDSGKDGLRIVMKGGFDKTESGAKRKQQAIVDFVCDEDRDGLEGEYDPEDKYERYDDALKLRGDPFSFRAADEDKDGGEDGDDDDDDDDDDDETPAKEVQLGLDKDPSLVFERYGPMEDVSNVDVLHLTWSSKYVCKSQEDDGSDGEDESPRSSHWGFFTWLVIIVFLGTAAYLIFGSWLNYNRYGARGWDLLPHGDTIRDIPYLMKDWTRRVLNTVQGSGSRGGYSAV
ncbi:autophagy-related protein 27 [Xylariomycetidae sp. FL0641]|nr:autophagy-related protein 27 [Xylariomycetidae sp. FL0641]